MVGKAGDVQLMKVRGSAPMRSASNSSGVS